MKETKWFTIEEAAEILRVPERTLADWRFRGIGPTYCKFGKSVRYSEADLNAWIEGNRHVTRVVQHAGATHG